MYGAFGGGIYVYTDADGVWEEIIDDATVPANDPTLQDAYDGIVLILAR